MKLDVSHMGGSGTDEDVVKACYGHSRENLGDDIVDYMENESNFNLNDVLIVMYEESSEGVEVDDNIFFYSVDEDEVWGFYEHGEALVGQADPNESLKLVFEDGSEYEGVLGFELLNWSSEEEDTYAFELEDGSLEEHEGRLLSVSVQD